MANDALFQDLARNTALFPKELSKAGRLWFTRRLLVYVRASAPTDERAEATGHLMKARTNARQCANGLSAQAAKDVYSLIRTELWVQIAYGMMGLYPEVFLTRDEAPFLKFIVQHRTRAVDRMRFDVNAPGVFTYPGEGGVLAQHPNIQALDPVQYWEGISQLPGETVKRYPFVLAPRGKQDPVAAVDKLFEPNPGDDEVELRSTFDCAAAAMIVHIAALLDAASDRAKLGSALVAEGSRYVAIDHPYGSGQLVGRDVDQGAGPIVLTPTGAGDHIEITVAFAWACPQAPFQAVLVDEDFAEAVEVESVAKTASGYTGKMRIDHLSRSFRAGSRLVPGIGRPEFHLTTDSRPAAALFERVFIPDDDLQIGDHIYVTSHPLHRHFLSRTSPWGGEHAFVCHALVTRRDFLRITGHGVPETTLKDAIDNQVLSDLNEFLATTRNVLWQQLKKPPTTAPKWSGPIGQLTNRAQFDAELREKYGQAPTAAVTGTCSVYEFSVVPLQDDVDQLILLDFNTYETLTFDGNVGSKRALPTDFVLYRKRTAGIAPEDWSGGYIPIERNPLLDPALPAEPPHYGLYYFDDVLGQFHVFFPLYNSDGHRSGGARRLSYDDIRDIAVMSGFNGLLFVTRPRVERDLARHTVYIAALKQKGALAASP